MMIKQYYMIIVAFVTFLFAQEECVDGRYLDNIFDINIETNIQYGENVNETILGSSYNHELFMDIYYVYYYFLPYFSIIFKNR